VLLSGTMLLKSDCLEDLRPSFQCSKSSLVPCYLVILIDEVFADWSDNVSLLRFVERDLISDCSFQGLPSLCRDWLDRTLTLILLISWKHDTSSERSHCVLSRPSLSNHRVCHWVSHQFLFSTRWSDNVFLFTLSRLLPALWVSYHIFLLALLS